MTYLKKIQSFNKENKIKFVIIDDDPTGCQTVHSVPLLTSWNSNLIADTLVNNDVVFILTNTRSLKPEEASQINREIAINLKQILKHTSNLRIISRSDSTLRGHLQEEVFALTDTLGPFDGVIIAPFFAEGGRVTRNDTHYLYQNGIYIPVSETEFARDPVFGYTVSSLPEWLEIKSEGYWKKEKVISLSIDDIRKGGPQKVAEKLMNSRRNQAIIINALNDEDMECAVWGICLAEMKGKQFLYRTAASFVRVRSGITKRKLFNPGKKSKHALLIAGSFTRRTTEQLDKLCEHANIYRVEIIINRIFCDEELYRKELIEKIDEGLLAGRNVLLMTERDFSGSGSTDENQVKGKEISMFISAIVAGLKAYPEVIISKGGITSHDVAKHGLDIEKSEVLGQVEPGVPLLMLSSESKAPGSYYIIFPGNVGQPDSLLRIMERLLIDIKRHGKN